MSTSADEALQNYYFPKSRMSLKLAIIVLLFFHGWTVAAKLEGRPSDNSGKLIKVLVTKFYYAFQNLRNQPRPGAMTILAAQVSAKSRELRNF